MYTTLQRTRDMSGFDDEILIPDTLIKSKILIAGSQIDGAIGYVYSLPISFHYQNTLSFSGTGAGSGTMAVVVNGTTYNVAIETGTTASQAADLFRTAAADSSDFITDALGLGDQVLIISKTDSENMVTAFAEVNITSAPITDGIAAAIGEREKRYPPILDQCTAEIATALLFIDQYGIEAQDTGKEGQTRMDIINDKLQKLQGVHESEQSIKIFDEVTQDEITLSTLSSALSFPNDVSNEDPNDPTAPKSFMNKVF